MKAGLCVSLMLDVLNHGGTRSPTVVAPLSSAASTYTDGTWCTVIHGSRADPDDCGQILYSLYLFYTIFSLLWSFFLGCVTKLQFIRTICDCTVAVQSCDPIDRTQLKQRDLGDRTAPTVTVRAVRWQTNSRPTALRSKSRSKEFWTFQNSALWLKRLVRPYGDLCHRPRPHWDRSATAVRPYCDLMRFGLKIGRSKYSHSTVAASVWLGY